MADLDLTLLMQRLDQIIATQQKHGEALTSINVRLDEIRDEHNVTVGLALRASGQKTLIEGLVGRMQRLERRLDELSK